MSNLYLKFEVDITYYVEYKEILVVLGYSDLNEMVY
jgi:hypothetical protein